MKSPMSELACDFKSPMMILVFEFLGKVVELDDYINLLIS